MSILNSDMTSDQVASFFKWVEQNSLQGKFEIDHGKRENGMFKVTITKLRINKKNIEKILSFF